MTAWFQWSLELVVFAAALPLTVASTYLLLLAALARPGRTPRPPEPPRFRFDLIVPAHDEALGIAETVKSLAGVDYPAELRRVVVVADNCTDDTARIAREAGATVLERVDPERRGKGYALAHAFARSLDEGRADAVVVIDADSVVSPNLLHAFAARLHLGARAVQAHYGVRNPGASWRTRLMSVALALFHRVRSLGRETLGVSCGLRGNGMCFRLELLREVPHEAFSLVEDLEYGIQLGRRGYRVWFADEADVLGEMVSGERASRSQRERWERGRAEMARLHGWSLLGDGLRRRSGLLVDLALDVLVPPLSRLVLGSLILLVICAVLGSHAGAGRWGLALASWSLVGLGLYVLAGWWHSRTGLPGLVALATAPAYVLWKLWLTLRRGRRAGGDWVRTRREGETGS